MEKQRKATSPKSSMASTGAKSPTRNGGSPPHKKHTTTESRGRRNIIVKGGQDLLPEEAKRRSPTNSQTSPKRSPKHGQSQVQPLSYFRLHTEERAIRRAGFNYQVASKINTMEIIRRFEEKISKVIEEQEIKIMRREMVPKAQLMPVFDKPFFPQRSRRPLTVPKEPSFLKLKCCIGGEFHRHFCYNVKAIK